MAINMETAINNMYALKNRGIRYSMTGSRTGADGTGDCSGTVYDSLRKAGASDAGWVLNTDSMHDWLVKNGFKLIAQNKEWTAKRGDIVIFGPKGSSGGAAGHVVIFISNTQIIHCTYKSASANGVYVDNEATTCPYSMGWYVYRLNSTAPSNSTRFANGSQVKLLSKATHYQTGEKIPDNLKNKNYTVSGEKVVNQSSSVYAFLLKELYSWVLAQDLEAVSTGYPAKKVGETVTLLSSATHFQTGEKIDPSVKGKKYQIMQVKTVSQSKSKRAYLLAGIISWVLEQDVQ